MSVLNTANRDHTTSLAFLDPEGGVGLQRYDTLKYRQFDKLTDKQQHFAAYYADPACETFNNATQSAIKAGYTPKSANLASDRLLGNVKIRNEINEITRLIKSKAIKTRHQRQEFWSKVADDDTVSMPDRLRASELLGRSEADFTDNIANTVEDQTKTLTPQEQIEALQSQIKLLKDSEDAGTAVAV